MKLLYLKLENFGPYKNQEIDFTLFKTNKVLILGENRDEEGSSSNGAAKSFLFQAIAWCLSSKTSKEGKIKADDVIGPFGTSAKVILKLESQFILKIERIRGPKSSLKFWVNGDLKSTIDNSKKTMVDLLMYLGVSPDFHKKWFEDFMTMTYFSGEVARAFTKSDSTPKDRFDFISRYLALEILDLCKENTKTKLDKINDTLTSLNSELFLIESRLNGYSSENKLKEQIKILKNQKISVQNELKKLEESLEKIIKAERLQTKISNKEILIENKKSSLEEKLKSLEDSYEVKLQEYNNLEKVKEEISQLKSDISKIKIDSLHSKNEKQSTKLKEIEEVIYKLKNDIENKQKELDKINETFKVSAKCPNCQTDLMILNNEIKKLNLTELISFKQKIEINLNDLKIDLNNQIKIKSEILDLIKEIQKEITQYNINKQNLELLEIKSSNRDNLIKEINSIVEQKETWEETTKEYLLNHSKELETLKFQFKELGTIISHKEYQSTLKNLSGQIDELNSSIDRNQFIIEKIHEETSLKNEIQTKIKVSKKEVLALNFAIEGFPIIKKWRIDSFIPSFMVEVNSYLKKLKSKIKIKIDTESETKKGTIKNNFPIEAVDGYNKTRGLETFSEGEKSRISLSIAWALRSLTKDQNYLPFDFCMMDEIADGLDEVGIRNLSNLIEQSEGQFYVISHFNTFKDHFSETIKVIKENGESRIQINNL